MRPAHDLPVPAKAALDACARHGHVMLTWCDSAGVWGVCRRCSARVEWRRIDGEVRGEAATMECPRREKT
jgi:hypothetical protein